MSAPKVVHCRRAPRESFVYVGRENTRYGFAASPFANPFKVGRDGTLAEVIAKFAAYLEADPVLQERAVRELRGHDLGCWCAGKPCHGDVLLAVANA